MKKFVFSIYKKIDFYKFFFLKIITMSNEILSKLLELAESNMNENEYIQVADILKKVHKSLSVPDADSDGEEDATPDPEDNREEVAEDDGEEGTEGDGEGDADNDGEKVDEENKYKCSGCLYIFDNVCRCGICLILICDDCLNCCEKCEILICDDCLNCCEKCETLLLCDDCATYCEKCGELVCQDCEIVICEKCEKLVCEVHHDDETDTCICRT